MSLPNAGTWASSNAILQTQNTAPVREFRCLYTSDIRRKQKRWQDGRLKYHTFNKRIMVYDDRSNFVGDSHWREDHAFGEGQEVELERCGICVEVSECVGTREQDLTPLLNKVVKDRQERAHVRAVASSTPRPPGPSKQTQIVGISRADSTELRSAKRRKPDNSPTRKNGYAQNITGATLALSGTPSTAAPLRYDPAWSRTMKRSIEEIVMSESAGIHRMPQQRPVPINISHTKTNGSRTKNLSKKSPPALLRSGHAQNNTGAALVLASKTLTCSNLLSASGTARKVTTRLGNSHSAATTIEEDEFIDIDFYDEENLLVERTMTSPKVTNPAKNSQEKPLLNVHSHQTRSEGDQPERPFNPLRIRTRPKRKLLSAPSPPSRSPSLTELSTENGNRAVCPSTAPGNNSEPQGSLAPELQVASVTETGPPDVKGRRSPPQVNAGMDHYGIDVLLTRKAPGQSSIAKDQHAEVQSRTKNIIFTQCAERSNTCTGFEGQQKVLSKLTPGPQLEAKQKGMQSPRQLFMLRANIDTDIDKACTDPSKNFRVSPRLMKPFSEGVEANELRGLTIVTAEDVKTVKHTFQAGRDPTIKRDVIPFKLPAKLTCPTTQCTKLAPRENKQDGYGESVMPHMTVSTRAAVRKASMAREDWVANIAQGPWSREAFDLFDWRPGASTTGNSLAAG